MTQNRFFLIEEWFFDNKELIKRITIIPEFLTENTFENCSTFVSKDIYFFIMISNGFCKLIKAKPKNRIFLIISPSKTFIALGLNVSSHSSF